MAQVSIAIDAPRTFARFCVVGAVNTAVSFAVYQLLLFVLAPVASWTISFLTGLAISFAGNARYTFRVERRARAALPYAAFYLASLGASLLLLQATLALGVHARIAPVLVIACMLPVNFAGSRWILHRPRAS